MPMAREEAQEATRGPTWAFKTALYWSKAGDRTRLLKPRPITHWALGRWTPDIAIQGAQLTPRDLQCHLALSLAPAHLALLQPSPTLPPAQLPGSIHLRGPAHLPAGPPSPCASPLPAAPAPSAPAAPSAVPASCVPVLASSLTARGGPWNRRTPHLFSPPKPEAFFLALSAFWGIYKLSLWQAISVFLP